MLLVSDIKFPCWRLRQHERIYKDLNAIYVESEMAGKRILDDLSLEGDFLARRLKLHRIDSTSIYPLKYMTNMLQDILLNKTKRIWIDSKGQIFNPSTIKKIKFRPISCEKIESIKQAQNFEYIINNKYVYKGILPDNPNYINIVNLKPGYIVYSITENICDRKRVKI